MCYAPLLHGVCVAGACGWLVEDPCRVQGGSAARAKESHSVNQRTLRTLLASVETGIARATADAASVDDKQALTQAWQALVQHLALGPAPLTRLCPQCQREIMRAATVCGYCWSRLVPADTGAE